MLERVRSIAAPRGTGSLLCLSPSPHDRGATLAASGEGGACVVLDLRGDALVAHRLAADAGCFRAGDAVSAVVHDPANAHALYTRERPRRHPVGPPPPPHAREPHRARLRRRRRRRARRLVVVPRLVRPPRAAPPAPPSPPSAASHNTDEINTLAMTAEGDALCAADDAGDVVVVDLARRRRRRRARAAADRQP